MSSYLAITIFTMGTTIGIFFFPCSLTMPFPPLNFSVRCLKWSDKLPPTELNISFVGSKGYFNHLEFIAIIIKEISFPSLLLQLD